MNPYALRSALADVRHRLALRRDLRHAKAEGDEHAVDVLTEILAIEYAALDEERETWRRPVGRPREPGAQGEAT